MGIPARSTSPLASIRTPSPVIGSSNHYVLGELLGYTAAERATLVGTGAVWV
jgi:hypothetical protein